MPGSGKSTVGRELSKITGKKFYDLDRQIELEEGRSVSEIFNEKGEVYFRKIEADLLRKLIVQPESFVIATGGGTPCFHENMLLMNQNGSTIFIDPPLDILEDRLVGNKSRPLLLNDPQVPLLQKLQKMKEVRLPFYSMAHWRVSDETVIAERLVQLIP
jgi:shikimate kinase